MDFGGNSFISTARELQNRGHYVRWLFSESEIFDYRPQVKRLLSHYSIQEQSSEALYLTIDHHRFNPENSTKLLRQLLEREEYDCMVVDRVCVAAGVVARDLGIPWCAVGTDGRAWFSQPSEKYNRRVLYPLPMNERTAESIEDISQASIGNSSHPVRSYWAASPYLNLSFLPKTFYETSESDSVPEHSHFLGSGRSPDISSRSHVLLTFGNTMDFRVRKSFLHHSAQTLRKHRTPLLVLGSQGLNAPGGITSGRNNDIQIQEWLPYDLAFRRARLAIGHGGTSFVWNGLQNGIPLIALPSMGDQFFGAEQIEQLNLGVMVGITESYRRKLFKKFIPNISPVQVRKPEFKEALNSLLDNRSTNAACASMRKRMNMGGGVKAAADLLEILLKTSKPVTDCSSPSCCC